MELHSSDCKVMVRLLGPFLLQVGDDEVRLESWRSKKALSLFKYLVAKMGAKVPRGVLLNVLWPETDSSEEETKHRLHSTIYMMRKTLEKALGSAGAKPSFIAYAEGVYWFEPGSSCWVDTAEFEANYRLGLESEYSDPRAALAHYLSSIDLYKGDFLPEELYEDWAAGHREHYREMYISATIKAAELLAQIAQDYTKAVQICRNALRIDQYREELHQAIMANLIRAGRFAEAGYQYRQCMRMLYEEFGLEPSPETQSLFEEMKRLNHVPDVGSESQDKPDSRQGPFVCDRKTFESIYRLEMRRQARFAEPLSLITLCIMGKGGVSLRNSTMAALSKVLRQGDVLCVWDSNRISIQLPRTGQRECQSVRRRLEGVLQQKGGASIHFSTSTLPPGSYKEKGYSPLEELLPKAPPRASI